MIELNIDLSYLAKYFEIGSQSIKQYSTKSIDELMQAEAENGNKKAAGFEDFLKNPEKVAELFRLADANNRFLIIQNLSEDDLAELLQYFHNSALIWGLKYFSPDKLVQLMQELPQEELLKIVLEKFSVDEIVTHMEKEELDDFLNNEKVEREDIMNVFKQLKPDQFKVLMSQIFGAQAQDITNREKIMSTLDGLDDKEFMNTIDKFDDNGKKFIVWSLVNNDEKLIKEFNNETLARHSASFKKAIY
jgi:Mg/Co/Ni transporter MgtE